MKKLIVFFIINSLVMTLISCGNKNKEPENTEIKDTIGNSGDAMDQSKSILQKRIDIYAPVTIKVDLSRLTDDQRKLIGQLVEAGKLADEIFWKQTSPGAIELRDSLMALHTPEARVALEFVKINYGPYDRIDNDRRYIGSGPAKKPPVANFYPQDMTKEEFNKYVEAHPDQKSALESQYTVVRRDGDLLVAIPYHEEYPEALLIAEKLDKASGFADNKSLKNYLKLRADAIRTDNYYKSDMAWMDVKNNDIDVVIGPIENYEDQLFNYKTAYECIVMIKDPDATKELDMFYKHIDDFEHNLPYDKKYIRKTAGKGNILQVVNVAYMGGDCQAGVKTIANSLPNDPKVTEKKGGKKSMFKNFMEAKFDKIVVPIAQKILDESLLGYVDKKAFTSFVTLHEVSHTLGRGYVYGKKNLPVRKALEENYSTIEETKADILSMYNHKYLLDAGIFDENYIMKAITTYIAGLFRSIRFGPEEAHGKANLIQLNYLMEKNAIILGKNGKLNFNRNTFFDACGGLAGLILTTEAEGDYAKSKEIIAKYGAMNRQIAGLIGEMSLIPRDINTAYEL